MVERVVRDVFFKASAKIAGCKLNIYITAYTYVSYRLSFMYINMDINMSINMSINMNINVYK
jgi:hypothetical protein